MSELRENLIAQLKVHEGFKPYAYKDPLGYWTIGYGRLIDARKGGGISKAEALYLLNNDIDEAEKNLDDNLPWWKDKPDTIKLVLLNMCFNMGINGLLTFKNMLKHMERNEYKDAADHIRSSLYHQQVGDRAEQMAKLVENA